MRKFLELDTKRFVADFLKLIGEEIDNESFYRVGDLWLIQEDEYNRVHQMWEVMGYVAVWEKAYPDIIKILRELYSHDSNKLSAVKYCKDLTKLGLKEAKELCDNLVFKNK